MTSDGSVLSYDDAGLNKYFDVYLTGEKGWLGPFEIHKGDLPIVDDDPEIAIVESMMNNSKLQLLFNVPISVDPIVALDPKVIPDPIQTGYPAAKIVFKFNQESEADSAIVFKLYEQWCSIKINWFILCKSKRYSINNKSWSTVSH